MKVEFEGTPEQVLRDMREFIARCALAFGDEAEDTPGPSKPHHEPPIEPPTPNIVSIPPSAIRETLDSNPSTRPVKTCRFCHGAFSRLKSHEPYCEKNPEKREHALVGQKRPGAGRPSKITEQYIKGEFDVPF